MFDRILVATDGSSAALLAAELSGRLCRSQGTVRLLHVTSGLRDLAAMGFDSAANVIAGAMGDLRERVQLEESATATLVLEQTRGMIAEVRRVETVERTGRPASTILEEAEHAGADSLVIGSRGRGAIVRALFGSVADAVARGSTHRPVLISRRPEARKVLVALDGSEPSVRAALAAAVVAQRMGGELLLLTVVDVPVTDYERNTVIASVRTSMEALLRRVRGEIAALAPNVKIEDSVLLNEAATGVLSEASRLGSDLIALGRSGWTNNTRLALGTVAQRVMTHADASVLLVP